jgi:hypothetical protein
MTDPRTAFEDSRVQKRRLTMHAPSHALMRHPDDGIVCAEPYPLGGAARRALRALTRLICPPPPAPQPERLVDEVELTVRRFMSYMPPLAARALWLCLLLLDWAPLYLCQSFHRLHALGRERGSALLTEMVHGRYSALRTMVVAVRGLILSAYFDQDVVHRAMGYAPLPFMTERIARRRRLLAAGTLEPARAHAGAGR